MADLGQRFQKLTLTPARMLCRSMVFLALRKTSGVVRGCVPLAVTEWSPRPTKKYRP